MTTNRLAKNNGSSLHRSVFRAKEWAAMAEAKGLHEAAKVWRQAHEDGWDDEHYDQLSAERYRLKIAEARARR